MLSAVTFTSMEAQAYQQELKELIYSILPEIIEKYFREREKELYSISLIERLIRVEEELKALRSETNYRFEALMREMDARFAAQMREMDARFAAQMREMDARFEAFMREMNARFAAQKEDSDAKFEAINARFEAFMREMNARFEAQMREMTARFESLEKRLNFIQWFIGICFTIIMLALTLFNFLKF